MTVFSDNRSNRIDPARLDTTHQDHQARYEFAVNHVDGGTLLDAGCGFGYGTTMLTAKADRIVGIDMYPEAIAYAQEHYSAATVRFELADLLGFDPPEAPFDNVVCLEVVEHVQDDAGFVSALRRLVAAGGTLIASTPNKDVTSPQGPPADPTHVREYTPQQFRTLLADAGFHTIDLYGLHLGEAFFARQQARARLGRADRLGLRRFVPAALKDAIVRRASPAPPDVGIDSSLAGAHHQIAVAS